ncbi:MAG TPA: polyprenyl synthetase family protein [Nannocystaceae bacterium]|nr:polyprenyl synthetase family protein [Nannocystaceae bacterium]
MTTFDLEAWITDRRARVDAALQSALPNRERSDPGRLREAMHYAVMLGGKRMRPLLTVAACEAAGGTCEQALPAACAIEMVHAYSLVHDDLPSMDDDALRRGQPTVHVAFGEDKAVLCGDALLTLAFETLARGQGRGGRIVEAVVRLGHYAGIEGMVGGQAMDLDAGQDVRDLEALEAIHAKKTGALYAASGAMGALCAGVDDDLVARLERWGMQFGIAFQHADDLLDDEQVALREQAIARVDNLVASCLDLVHDLGPGAEAVRAIAQWVHERTHAAAAGEKRE